MHRARLHRRHFHGTLGAALKKGVNKKGVNKKGDWVGQKFNDVRGPPSLHLFLPPSFPPSFPPSLHNPPSSRIFTGTGGPCAPSKLPSLKATCSLGEPTCPMHQSAAAGYVFFCAPPSFSSLFLLTFALRRTRAGRPRDGRPRCGRIGVGRSPAGAPGIRQPEHTSAGQARGTRFSTSGAAHLTDGPTD